MNETNSQIEPQVADSTVDPTSEAVQALQAAMDGSEQQPVEQTEQEQKPPVEQDEAKKAEEARFAAKFAALSRKEKALKQREAQLQQRMQQIEEQLKQKEAEVSSKYIDPARFKREPLKVMEETGLTFEQIAEMVLNDGKPTPDMKLKEVMSPLEQKLKDLEEKLAKKEADEAAERERAAIENFTAQLTDFVNADETYELIKANDAVEMVFDVIKAHHDETGEILSNKEACDAVEEYLLEEAKKMISRDKVKKLLQPETATKPAPAKGAGKPQPTLSNAQAAQAPKSTGRKLSDEESKAEAAKLIKWVE